MRREGQSMQEVGLFVQSWSISSPCRRAAGAWCIGLGIHQAWSWCPNLDSLRMCNCIKALSHYRSRKKELWGVCGDTCHDWHFQRLSVFTALLDLPVVCCYFTEVYNSIFLIWGSIFMFKECCSSASVGNKEPHSCSLTPSPSLVGRGEESEAKGKTRGLGWEWFNRITKGEQNNYNNTDKNNIQHAMFSPPNAQLASE